MIKTCSFRFFGFSFLFPCLLLLLVCKPAFSNVCTDLLKTKCEDKRNCGWVKGYTNDKGERKKGYCRKQASKSKSTTTKKKKQTKKSPTNVCSDLFKADCDKKRNCNWVTGYTTDKGDRIKGYCRKKAVESKKASEKKQTKHSGGVCSDLLKVDCEGKKRSCNWVKGYTNDKGDRKKGYCRKKGSKSTKDEGGKNNIIDMLQDMLQKKK